MRDQPFSLRLPRSIVFGRGALAELPRLVRELEARRVCLVTDPGVRRAGWVDRVVALLEGEGLEAAVFDRVEAEPDIRSVDECAGLARDGGGRVFIGLGGGSALDVAKGAAIVAGHGGSVFDYLGVEAVPGPTAAKILIPTTAGTGSEVTPFAVFKDKAEAPEKSKKAIQSRFAVAEAALVDPELTLSCPPRVTAVTGMDALVHAVESYTSLKASPLTEELGLKALYLLGRNLLKAFANGANLEARYNMSLGSFYAGIGIANAGSGGVAALSYPVEGAYQVIHGIGNSLFLPYVLEYNSIADPGKIDRIAAALGLEAGGGREAVGRIKDLINHFLEVFGFPRRLRDLGAKKEDLPGLAEDALTRQRLLANNMRRLEYEDLLAICEMAF